MFILGALKLGILAILITGQRTQTSLDQSEVERPRLSNKTNILVNL